MMTLKRSGKALMIAAGLGPTIGLGAVGCGNTMTNSASQVVLAGPPEGMKIGGATTIGVRPDVLGTARDLPVPVGTDRVSGAGMTVSGTLHSVSGDWIVLDDASTGMRHWISLDTVNWIRQEMPAATSGHEQDAHGHADDEDHGEG